MGTTGGARLRILTGGSVVIDVDLSRARDARERCLEAIVGA